MYSIYYRENITGLPYETGLLEINLNLPIIHAWIHVLKHLEQIAYFFNARHAYINEWPIQGLCGPKLKRSDEQKAREKKAFKDSKQEFQDKASDPEGLNRLLDMPDPFGSNGNMDTGAIVITSNIQILHTFSKETL